MYGSVPGLYKNLEAALTVAKGYSIEENVTWHVVVKECDISNITWYRPCRASCIKEAARDGYNKVYSL